MTGQKPSRMNRSLLRYWPEALAVLVGFAAGVTIAADQVVRAAVDSDALAAAAAPSRLHFLSIWALSTDLEDSDVLEPLRGTPYELDQEEIEGLLVEGFSEADVVRKARQVHSDLVAYGSEPYDDSVPVFAVDISGERRVLADVLSAHLVGTLEGLPDCGLVGDADALWSGIESKLGMADGEEVVRDMPTCHPTELVAGPLREGFQVNVTERIVAHDAVDVLPRPDWDPATYRNWLERARLARLVPASAMAAGLVLAATGVLFSFALGRPRTATSTLGGVGLSLAAAAAVLAFAPNGQAFEELILGRILEPLENIPGDAWRALILEFERPAIDVAARRCALAAGAILGLAVALHARSTVTDPNAAVR